MTGAGGDTVSARSSLPPRRSILPADLLESARREGLDLETDAALCDESGLDFVVVHAHERGSGTTWIVRRPRRPSVLESARIEGRTLALVRPRLPIAVPDWRVFANDVIAYPKLSGTPAVSFDPGAGPRWNIIDPATPSAPFLDSLAAAVAALQAIPLEAAQAAGVRVSSLADERAWLSSCMERTREALAPSAAVWRRWHDWLESDAVWPPRSVMVHGDLHPGHWLLDETGHLTGILDWTTSQIGDPGTDFGLIHGAFGRSGLEALLAPFERAGGKTWPGLLEHARLRWEAFPAIAADFGLQTNDAGVLEHARRLLATADTGTS